MSSGKGISNISTHIELKAVQTYNKVSLAREFGWSEKQIDESSEEFINSASTIINLINHKTRNR